MQLDGATITIERRTTGGCIDLASVFYRKHFAKIFVLLVIFAVPSCLLTGALVNEYDLNMWVGFTVFLFVSPFFSAALVGGAGRRAFGESFTVKSSLALLKSRFGSVLAYTLLPRAAIVFFVSFLPSFFTWLVVLGAIPAILIASKWGFSAEVAVLENAVHKKIGSRMRALLSGVGSDVTSRLAGILLFTALLVVGWFVLLDLGAWIFLGTPVVYGRLTSLIHALDEIGRFSYDTRFVVSLQALMWLAYPLARLAWYFCYLDVRIQKEGWDVELDFRIEAQRLMEVEQRLRPADTPPANRTLEMEVSP